MGREEEEEKKPLRPLLLKECVPRVSDRQGEVSLIRSWHMMEAPERVDVIWRPSLKLCSCTAFE